MTKTCGHSFSKSTLEEWLAHKQTCPTCNRPLRPEDVMPNYKLREAIAKYDAFTKYVQEQAKEKERVEQERRAKIKSKKEKLKKRLEEEDEAKKRLDEELKKKQEEDERKRAEGGQDAPVSRHFADSELDLRISRFEHYLKNPPSPTEHSILVGTAC